jgi:hypothetical protein
MIRRKIRQKNRKQKNLVDPPQILETIRVQRHTFRFQAGSGVSARPIAGFDLLGLLGVATSATGVSSILASVRIVRISIYSPTATTNVTYPAIVWSGENNSEFKIVSDAGMDTSRPGVVTAVPPRLGDAGWWYRYESRAQVVVQLTVPISSIVDVEADIVFNNSTKGGTILTYVSSGLTAGQLLWGPLDHNTGAPVLNPFGPTYYA